MTYSQTINQITEVIEKIAWSKGSNEYIDPDVRILEDLMGSLDKSKINLGNHNELRSLERASRIITSYANTGRQILPRFLVTTMPKSGTKHLENCLEKKYNIDRYTPLSDYQSGFAFPNRIKRVFWEESGFVYGDSFISYHLLPSEEIISQIRVFHLRTIILLRNPIQAIVSSFYYCKKTKSIAGITRAPGINCDLNLISNDSELIDALVESSFPQLVFFIKNWCNAHMFLLKLGLPSKLLFQEELALDPKLFHLNLHTFLKYNQPFEDKFWNGIINHNFRKGSVDEWKGFFKENHLRSLIPSLEKLIYSYPFLGDYWSL